MRMPWARITKGEICERQHVATKQTLKIQCNNFTDFTKNSKSHRYLERNSCFT